MSISSDSDLRFPPGTFVEEKVDPLFKYTTDYVSKEMNGGIIRNHSTTDAWYLFRKIFAVAERRKLPVTIVTGGMREDFYNCLTDELEALIAKTVPVRAYLTEIAPADIDLSKNQFAEILSRASGENPDSYKLKGGVMQGAPKIPHVIYAGDNGLAFRLEKDPSTHAAVGSFGPLHSPLGQVAVKQMSGYIEQIESLAK
ncbi:MAG: hypothetical protein OXU61_10060 [Gammaproteobacteria bacterium]|nr:hypothetical protein [Gammaproteobacteria bacterium]